MVLAEVLVVERLVAEVLVAATSSNVLIPATVVEVLEETRSVCIQCSSSEVFAPGVVGGISGSTIITVYVPTR